MGDIGAIKVIVGSTVQAKSRASGSGVGGIKSYVVAEALMGRVGELRGVEVKEGEKQRVIGDLVQIYQDYFNLRKFNNLETFKHILDLLKYNSFEYEEISLGVDAVALFGTTL